MMKRKVIHMKEAIRLLESGDLCDIKVWKLSTGDIIEYKGVQCIGSHWRGGCHRIKLSVSGQIRLRDYSPAVFRHLLLQCPVNPARRI